MFTLKFGLKTARPILYSFFLVTMVSCNQQEFYEKEFLDGVGVPDAPKINLPADDLPDANVGGDVNTGDTNNGGDTNNTGNTNNGGDTNNTGNTNNGGNTNNTGNTNNGGDTNNTGNTNNGGDTNNTGNTNNGGNTNTSVCAVGSPQNAEDQFIQNSAQQGKVDIVWVMDNSGSMGDEQDALARNFDSFIQEFIQRGIDFQMAITTTDGRRSYNGRMIGNPAELTSAAAAADEATFLQNFADQIKVGTRGSGQEMGLHTSESFFTRYQDWIRPDAFMIVVYVSDEEDQSSQDVAHYINTLQALKSNTGMVKAYSIVTKELDHNKRWETLGHRYEQVSNATGGLSADIHQDFYQTLRNFGGTIVDLVDTFPLSGEPINNQIEITLNGQPLNIGWEYDSVSRVVRFDQSAIPAEGSIVIAYYQKCVGQ